MAKTNSLPFSGGLLRANFDLEGGGAMSGTPKPLNRVKSQIRNVRKMHTAPPKRLQLARAKWQSPKLRLSTPAWVHYNRVLTEWRQTPAQKVAIAAGWQSQVSCSGKKDSPDQQMIIPAHEGKNHRENGGGPGREQLPLFAPRQPILIDLFCKAGGATKGYQQAGFYVIGVDIDPQPRYCGDGFIQWDLTQGLPYEQLAALGVTLATIAAFHASPPCEHYSSLTKKKYRSNHADLIVPTRDMLQGTGKPYVIENVQMAKHLLINPLMLHGSMFGLRIFRDRYFEINPPLYFLPTTPRRDFTPVPINGSSKQGNTYAPAKVMGEAMEIDWMIKAELRKAIPPAYTKFIGDHLMKHLQNKIPPRGAESGERPSGLVGEVMGKGVLR